MCPPVSYVPGNRYQTRITGGHAGPPLRCFLLCRGGPMCPPVSYVPGNRYQTRITSGHAGPPLRCFFLCRGGPMCPPASHVPENKCQPRDASGHAGPLLRGKGFSIVVSRPNPGLPVPPTVHTALRVVHCMRSVHHGAPVAAHDRWRLSPSPCQWRQAFPPGG
jgi:hypothetical protein